MGHAIMMNAVGREMSRYHDECSGYGKGSRYNDESSGYGMGHAIMINAVGTEWVTLS